MLTRRPLLLIVLMMLVPAMLLVESGAQAQTLDPVLVSNTAQASGTALTTADGQAVLAQAITTGNHPDGYYLTSVELGLAAAAGVTVEVELWRAFLSPFGRHTALVPTPGLHIMTLAGPSAIDNDSSTLESFTTNDVLLLPDTVYWVVVRRTGGAVDGLSAATASSPGAVDAGGLPGFSLRSKVWSSLSRTMANYDDAADASLKVRLRGSEATRPPGPYVTNRNYQTWAAPAETAPSASRYATSFRPNANFFSSVSTFELTSVLLSVAAEEGVTPRVAIHADAGGSPAKDPLDGGTLTAPADLSRVLASPARAEFTAETPITVIANTTYWVVLDVGSGSGKLSVGTTASNDQDKPVIQRVSPEITWSIGNRMIAYDDSNPDKPKWSADSADRSFRMALNGTTNPFDAELHFGPAQVGVGLVTFIQDQGGPVRNESWQWQRGNTSAGPFTDIPADEGGTMDVYVPAPADLGKWLRLTVTYDNAFTTGISLSATSNQPVLSRPSVSTAGQTSTFGGYALGEDDPEAVAKIAQAFTTGPEPSGYVMAALRFGLALFEGTAFSWALHADDGGRPAATPLFDSGVVPPGYLDSDPLTFEDLVHPGFLLAPNTRYWAVLTASSAFDYPGVLESVTFNAGETSKTFIFTAADDEADDDGESVRLTFGTLPVGVNAGTTTQTTVDVTDNDDPAVRVSFGEASYGAVEGGTVTVTVRLNADPERTVTIPLRRTNRGGAAGDDYSGVPESVSFNAGETSKTFIFTVADDAVDEDGESVKLTFGALPAGVRKGATPETTVAISDDLAVSFEQASYGAAEGGTVTVTVTLNADPERRVTIPLTRTNQGGAADDDYSGVPESVTFNAGETSKTFIFTVADDEVDESGESVKLTFGALPAGVRGGAITETTVAITGDDDLAVSFAAASYAAAEGGEVTVTVTLSADPERTVTIPLKRTNQGGTADDDYRGVPGSVTFNAGDTSKTFIFTAAHDAVDDDGESVMLTFGTLPVGVNAGTTTETTVAITDDDDPAVRVSFGAASYAAAEGGTVTVTVQLNADPERTVTVPITRTNRGGAADDDYSGVPESVIFNAGDTSRTFIFTVADDDVGEDGESVKLTFGTLPAGVRGGAITETTVAITGDDDPTPAVSFGEASYGAAEGGTVTVTVTLSAGPQGTVTIPLVKTNQGGAADDDYSGVPESVTFNAGETSKTFIFTAADDEVDDDGESVMLTFGALPAGVSEGAITETTVAITRDDDLTVSFGEASYTVAEGGMVRVTVTLSADPERTVTIPITRMNQGGAVAEEEAESTIVFTAISELAEHISLDIPDAELDPGSEPGWTVGVPALGFLGNPASQTWETIDETLELDGLFVLQMAVITHPVVTASFEQSTYTVDESDDTDTPAEEHKATVTVTLSEDPQRTVTIPITRTHQGGATEDDYSGVPETITFNAGETEKSFTFTASEDDVDDDEDAVLLGFTLPFGVNPGTTAETTVAITDDDDPQVMVGFGAPSYSVGESDDTNTPAEENKVTVTVTLSADPERTVTIPITKTNQGETTDEDYSGVPANVVFNTGETEKIFTFTAATDDEDDDEDAVLLGFGDLPDRVTKDATNETTVYIVDDDAPEVTVTFGAASHSVAEGDDPGTTEEKENEAVVTVTLSADPERTVAIPIKGNHLGGSTADDYTIPETVVFDSGETEKTFIFAAVDDDLDDDDESVLLTFDPLPVRVTAGTTPGTTITIADDDDPWVMVSFGAAEYTVAESDDEDTTEMNEGQVTVTVTLSADPERTVTIPITRMNQDGATEDDYSGVPASLTFDTGVISQTFVFSGAQDDVHDEGETVDLGFGPLPDRVTPGSPEVATVTINTDCDSLWCGTVTFEPQRGWDPNGRRFLSRVYPDVDDALETDVFPPKSDEQYLAWYMRLMHGPSGTGPPRPTFHIPDRAFFLLSLINPAGSDAVSYSTMPNEDYLDWTVHLTTEHEGETLEAVLPFSDAQYCCDNLWKWYGLDLHELTTSWEPGKEFRVRIASDPQADREAKPLGPPLHLRADAVNAGSAVMAWVRPQLRDDSTPKDVTYKIQWKPAFRSWDAPGAVSEHVFLQDPDKDGVAWTIRGLVPDAVYHARVFAINAAGESLPSNQAVFRTAMRPARDESNFSAGILGEGRVGETLTATVRAVEEGVDLGDYTLTYQWLRTIPGTMDVTELAGETGPTYVVVADDLGKGIRVWVTFTDEHDNRHEVASVGLAIRAEPGGEESIAQQQAANNPPEGLPVITRDGETFTADTSGITDDDGLGSPGFTYQWIRRDLATQTDADIAGATGPTYTSTAEDVVGKALVVRVTFTDDLGNEHSLTSIALAMVPPQAEPGQEPDNTPPTGEPYITGTASVGETLIVEIYDIADEDGLTSAEFTYQWVRRDLITTTDTDIAGETGETYTVTGDDVGKALLVRVTFTDDLDNEQSLTSAATSAVTAASLKLSDFDAGDSQRVLASALILVGDRGRKNDENQDRAWYATDTAAWHASGELQGGSLAWNGMTLSRVAYFPDTDVLRFNDAEDTVHIGNTFAAGGANHEATIWIQTASGTVSFKAKDHIVNSGGGWINFEVPPEARATLEAIAKDDLIIVALSVPADP